MSPFSSHYFVPGTVLGSGESEANKTDLAPAPRCLQREQGVKQVITIKWDGGAVPGARGAQG